MHHLPPWLRFVAGFLPVAAVGWSCTVGWQPHPQKNTFELVGLHAPLACVDCHPEDEPIGPLPAACASCHEDERPLDHYTGDCGECHTPFGWDDIVVDHSFFPLTQAHDLDCDSCHLPDTFQGLDPACASCHEPDRPADHYDGQDCGSCHRPTTWGDLDIDHDPFFPIPHEGVDDCAECHLDPDDYSRFSCTVCHGRERMDKKHDDEPTYTYEDRACLRCHPDGKE